MERNEDITPMEEELLPVRIGSKECLMPKTFFVKDLKSVAGIGNDRSIILHRGDKSINLTDDDEVEIEEGDYFKDVPRQKQGLL